MSTQGPKLVPQINRNDFGELHPNLYLLTYIPTWVHYTIIWGKTCHSPLVRILDINMLPNMYLHFTVVGGN